MTADLSALPLATRTDLEIQQLKGSVIEARDGYVVLRSPDEPRYHWGNCLYVTTGDVEDAAHWTATFNQEFPDADWLAIGLPAVAQGDGWQRLGLDPEPDDSLILHGMPGLRPLPDGYHVRPFNSDADWAQRHALIMREEPAGFGMTPAAYEPFALDTQRTERALVEDGHLAWFGAFRETDDALAAQLGIAVLGDDRRLARYQAVRTDARFRGRGLAGHLLGIAAQWAADQGADTFVIVTEPTNAAGRLYRGVGFRPDLAGVGVYQARRFAGQD